MVRLLPPGRNCISTSARYVSLNVVVNVPQSPWPNLVVSKISTASKSQVEITNLPRFDIGLFIRTIGPPGAVREIQGLSIGPTEVIKRNPGVPAFASDVISF